jgi:hypothetical protein
MTCDWDGRRSRVLSMFRAATGIVLLVVVLCLPLLMFV